MCSFATQGSAEFNAIMLRFVSAQAGLIVPRPGQNHFNLSAQAETRAAPGVVSPRLLALGAATARDEGEAA